jgi:hypothetical protein
MRRRIAARSIAIDKGIMIDAPLKGLLVLLLCRVLVLCLQRSRRFLPCFVASLLQLRPLLMGLQLWLLVPPLLLLRQVYHPHGFSTLVPLFI